MAEKNVVFFAQRGGNGTRGRGKLQEMLPPGVSVRRGESAKDVRKGDVVVLFSPGLPGGLVGAVKSTTTQQGKKWFVAAGTKDMPVVAEQVSALLEPEEQESESPAAAEQADWEWVMRRLTSPEHSVAAIRQLRDAAVLALTRDRDRLVKSHGLAGFDEVYNSLVRAEFVLRVTAAHQAESNRTDGAAGIEMVYNRGRNALPFFFIGGVERITKSGVRAAIANYVSTRLSTNRAPREADLQGIVRDMVRVLGDPRTTVPEADAPLQCWREYLLSHYFGQREEQLGLTEDVIAETPDIPPTGAEEKREESSEMRLLRKELEISRSTVASTESALAHANASGERKSREINELVGQVSDLKNQLDDKNGHVAEEVSKRMAAETRCRDLEKKLADMPALEERVDRFEAEMSSLRDELETMEEALLDERRKRGLLRQEYEMERQRMLQLVANAPEAPPAYDEDGLIDEQAEDEHGCFRYEAGGPTPSSRLGLLLSLVNTPIERLEALTRLAAVVERLG